MAATRKRKRADDPVTDADIAEASAAAVQHAKETDAHFTAFKKSHIALIQALEDTASLQKQSYGQQHAADEKQLKDAKEADAAKATEITKLRRDIAALSKQITDMQAAHTVEVADLKKQLAAQEKRADELHQSVVTQYNYLARLPQYYTFVPKPTASSSSNSVAATGPVATATTAQVLTSLSGNTAAATSVPAAPAAAPQTQPRRPPAITVEHLDALPPLTWSPSQLFATTPLTPIPSPSLTPIGDLGNAGANLSVPPPVVVRQSPFS